MVRWFNKMFFWDFGVKPKHIILRVRAMTDEQLRELRCAGWSPASPASSGSPRALQIKAINREIKRRKA
jgi:hypothetical protein